MQVVSRVDSSIDQSVVEAFEESRGEPVRIRVQPAVRRRPDLHQTYLAWKDLHWMVEVESLKEAQLFREALAAFFNALHQHGLKKLKAHLLTTPAA